MSRCSVCNTRLNDYEFRACKDTCGKCQFEIDMILAEEDYSIDRSFVMEDEVEGKKDNLHDLDYYDNLESFDEEDN